MHYVYYNQKGMDFGIVDAGKLPIYEDIEINLRNTCEDAVLNRDSKNIVDRLLSIAEKLRAMKVS